MDTIRKKIYNGDFVNRFCDTPDSGGSHQFGYDISLGTPGTEIFSFVNIPKLALSGDTGVEYVRFRTLANYFTRTKSFLETAECYKMCIRYGNEYWRDMGKAFLLSGDCSVAAFSAETYDSSVISDFEEGISGKTLEIGDQVVVGEDAAWINSVFNGDLSYVVEFYNVSCVILKNNLGNLSPYFDVFVHIDEKIEDLGVFSVYEDENSAESGLTDGFYEDGGENNVVFVDSYIQKLKREKKSYDFDGNELPFINGDGCEIPYLIGQAQNVTLDEYGDCIYDTITSIAVENSEGVVTEFGDGERISYNSPVFGESGEIEFTYERGRRMVDDNSFVSGIVYVERYAYEAKTGEFDLDGYGESEYTYINVLYDTPADSEWGGYAKTVLDDSRKNDIFEHFNIFYDESLAGAHGYSESVSVGIERGSSASFEPLSLMGQMNSVEDIERYRGDLFKIAKENV